MSKRYFEFVEGGSKKFWEIAVDETRQTVRFGKLGTDGQTKTKSFDSPSRARSATRKLIAEKIGKGYVEVGGGPVAFRDEKLELAIEQSPDEPAAYLAYARWLQSKGDVRGEVIVKHVAKPNDRSLIQKHREYLFGDLASGDAPQVFWQFGVMNRVQIVAMSGSEAADDLEGVLSLPSGRFVRELEVGVMSGDVAPSLQPCVDVLVKRKAPVTLRSLALGGEGDDARTGKIAPLAKAFPRLEQLTLFGDKHELGKNVSWLVLRELTIGGEGLTKSVIKDLLSSRMSKLERLTLVPGLELTAKDLAPLLASDAFPSLKHVAVIGADFLDELGPMLSKSKLFAQLSSLDFSKSEVDADAFASVSFAHLKELTLDDKALAKKLKSRR
jgi:uncharacterized protein (TIGR02996 family)